MIKLFVSDLDGTLLNVDHNVSKETKEAVKKLRAAGVSFMPASGRDYRMLMDVMKQLEITPKVICLNGAEFYDNTGKLVKSIPVSIPALRQVIKVIDKYNLDVDFYCEDGCYNYGKQELFYDICLARYQALFHDNKKENLLKFMDENELLKNTYCEPDFEEIIKHNIMKVEIFFSNLTQRSLVFKEMRKIEDIQAVGSHDLNLEITNASASKGEMVELVASMYGFENDEVVVIGDGFNDASMLQRFNNSFCMGQASLELKKLATYEAPKNKEHGVAYVINHLLKNDLCINDESIEDYKKE